MDIDMEKEEIIVVPIWIQLKLNFKYWGEKYVFKIVIKLENLLREIMQQHAGISSNFLG